jgi:hypothetical protein
VRGSLGYRTVHDAAADLRDEFRDLIAEGLAPAEATARLVADYGVGPGGADDNDFWLGLAVTAHKLGRLTEDVRRIAMRILDDPAELARWPDSSKRQRNAALAKARQLLTQPQPAPKPLRKRTKADTALAAGQHVRWHLGHDKPDALFRVTGIHQDKGGRYPQLLALDWNGAERSQRKANRLDALSGGPDPLSGRDAALGFTALGRPSDPHDLVILDCTADRRTPTVGHRQHLYVVARSDMHRFFTASGRAAIPPERPPAS